MATILKTFTGESAVEALSRAKEECGESAMLVSTKQIQAKTLTKKPIYEVLVSVETDNDEAKAKRVESIKKQIENYTRSGVINSDTSYLVEHAAASTAQKPTNSIATAPAKNLRSDENVLLNISAAAKEISRVVNIEPTQTNPEIDKKLDAVTKQINRLTDAVGMIADMIWDDKAANRGEMMIPPEFATIYKLAKQSGMKEEHLNEIMRATITNMPPQMKSNPVAVTRYFYSLMRNMLPCRSENIERKSQRVMMLVGPTGVGKTTTLSKLAYKFAHSGDVRYKTGIITLDTYRLGAVEQLFQYAKIMNIPMLDAIEIDDFRSALKSLASCDLILIDTMGSSQYDKEKLQKLQNFLQSSGVQIDVSLVLSAGSKVDDLMEIYKNFSFLNIDTMIITKLDETKIFGNIFSLIYETGVPVSFFSTGQNVPDDILEAKSEFLVKCVLEGFSGDGDNNV